jgi:uncharacterized protein
MIKRDLEKKLLKALNTTPVVALVGPRQVGKTTLVLEVTKQYTEKETVYLDLELDSDLAKLTDTEAFLRRFENKLLIIDEIQRKPELFRTLRGLVDIRKRLGETGGQFLLLGSASRDLLQHSSETLAGRIRYLELCPFSIREIYNTDPVKFSMDKLWLRGGFPDSYLSEDNSESWEWRNDFIKTYVERDIPLMGPHVPAAKLNRFWRMLAHYHGQQINMTSLCKSLETSHTTIKTYLDILTDFYMIRQISPWAGNSKKRLVKSPKIYLRDSGLLHRLLNIFQIEDLMGHPVVGMSWEGFVIENILRIIPNQWQYSYYRTQTGSEIDLILEGPSQETWAIEVKISSAPKLRKEFHDACLDIKAKRKIVLYNGVEQFPLGDNTEAIGVVNFINQLPFV